VRCATSSPVRSWSQDPTTVATEADGSLSDR
jgi:hypothetical protein